MIHLNIEIKAKCSDPDKIRNILNESGARFTGLDHQTDTYFNVRRGRLKIREGNMENALIQYSRDDSKGPKRSEVILQKTTPGNSLKDILTKSLGILIEIRKKREIYFIDNIKFHIDQVRNLGSFIEIEAIDSDGKMGEPKLREQCQKFLTLLNICDRDLLSESYSDMLLAVNN